MFLIPSINIDYDNDILVKHCCNVSITAKPNLSYHMSVGSFEIHATIVTYYKLKIIVL